MVITNTDTTSTMNIEVFINNRDRLTTTKKMVEHLLLLNPNQPITIIDNGSTYLPLLDWYESIRSYVKVDLHENKGHLAFWHHKYDKIAGRYFVYTDSDLTLNPLMPKNWVEVMFDVMSRYSVRKVSLALEIDDLPSTYEFRNQVIRNESRWWLQRIQDPFYKLYFADTDTTFSLLENFHDNCYQSVRIADNFTAKHAPWYIDLQNLDEEEKYYLNNLDVRFNTQYSKQHLNPNQFPDK